LSLFSAGGGLIYSDVISPARQVAFSVLSLVEQGGYASDLLLAHSRRLESRDAGLAAGIVFGVLRRRAQLDYVIETLSNRSVSKLDTAVRVALRIGMYQLRCLDRVPAHAAVNESVELVKKARKGSAAPFVNAVLRGAGRFNRPWPNRSVALSMPEWILQGWDEQFGAAASRRIAEAFLEEPEIYVRNPVPRAGLILEETEVPGAFRVAAGDVSGLKIQDIGSQSIVPLLDLKPGLTFLDLCAAPGNKTAQALESGVSGIACDIHLSRVKTVSGCPRVVLDAAKPLPFATDFDRILIDAPCSGTGTLGRNPEIRWRIKPSHLSDLHEKQVRILREGLRHLASGGRLVYSTCSLERIENEAVTERVLAEAGVRFRLVESRRRTPGIEPGDGFFAAAIESRGRETGIPPQGLC
jgi:16S rRNA (cytosine967-C5)-methyltransferase